MRSPSFQFYPGDWFRDPGLRASSIAAKGAWAQILFSLHDAPEARGKMRGSLLFWSRLIGVSTWGTSNGDPNSAINLIIELYDNHVCDLEFDNDGAEKVFFQLPMSGLGNGVTERDIFVTVINRRMYREHTEKERKRKNQQNYRDRQRGTPQERLCDSNVTDESDQSVAAYSSSSSSSSSSLDLDLSQSDQIGEDEHIPLDEIELFFDTHKMKFYSVDLPTFQLVNPTRAELLNAIKITKAKARNANPRYVLQVVQTQRDKQRARASPQHSILGSVNEHNLRVLDELKRRCNEEEREAEIL